MKSHYKILLLDSDTVQTLSVLKALVGIGCEVSVLCSKKISYGYASKYPYKKILSKRSYDDELFLEELLCTLKKEKYDLVIPMFDDGALFLSKNKTLLEQYGVRVAVADYDKFMTAYDKGRFMDFCSKNNISHPETYALSLCDLNDIPACVKFPAILKPDVSSGAKGIRLISKPDQLYDTMQNLHKSYSAVSVQEYIENDGTYFNSMLYRSVDNIFSEIVVLHIKRYFPVGGGTSSFCETVKNSEIESLSKIILEKLDWVGFADMDFIVDKKTGVAKVIEINPRVPASVHAAYVSGVNFPSLIVSDIMSNNIIQHSYICGKKVRYIAMDILWFIFCKERFMKKHEFFPFFRKDVFFQDYFSDDPLPFFAGIIMGFIKYTNIRYFYEKILAD